MYKKLKCSSGEIFGDADGIFGGGAGGYTVDACSDAAKAGFMEDPYAKSALAYKEIVSKLVNKEATETVKRRGMAVFFSNFFNRKR